MGAFASQDALPGPWQGDSPGGSITAAQETTETPVATETPLATETPEATPTPEATGTPEASDTPEATETVQPTDTPGPTDTPEATPTGTPEASETPEGTETPEATETPEGGRRDIVGIPEDNPVHQPDDGDGVCDKGETTVKETPSGNLVNVPCHSVEPGPPSFSHGHQGGSSDSSGD